MREVLFLAVSCGEGLWGFIHTGTWIREAFSDKETNGQNLQVTVCVTFWVTLQIMLFNAAMNSVWGVFQYHTTVPGVKLEAY